MKRQLLAPISQLAIALAAVAAVVALTSSPASAARIVLAATLDGAQSLDQCPQGSAGTGSASLSYDDVTNELSWTILFGGTSSPPTAAHFHGPAGPGVSAPIQVDITDLISPSTGSAVITEAQEADLLAGLWYINYHTTKCPGGEIRGQVLPVPVGGVSLDPQVDGLALESAPPAEGGPASPVGLLAASGAAAVGLSSLAWYARRRWASSRLDR